MTNVIETYLTAQETADRLDINVQTFRKYFAAAAVTASTNGTRHPIPTTMRGRATLYSWPHVRPWWAHILGCGTQHTAQAAQTAQDKPHRAGGA
jgi:hypothetical protein